MRSVVLVLFISGCAVPEARGPQEPAVKVVEVKALAVQSHDAIKQNESGWVAGERVRAWQRDWAKQKPAGVVGDLVVLQFGVTSEAGYVAQSAGVRVYDAADLDMFVEPRNNGLVAVGRVPANGVRVDRLLRAYGARPGVDLILLVQGQATRAGLETLARTWLTLRYWGVPHEGLAVLTEPVSSVFSKDALSATSAAHPFNGTGRVSGLLVDHSALLASIGDVREAIGRSALLDVRPTAEFTGETLGASAVDDTCLSGAPACGPSIGGHIRSASSFPLERMLSGQDLRSPAELRSQLESLGLDRSQPVIVYGLDDGASAVAAFVLVGVLGVPARWYAPGYLEWGSLTAQHSASGLELLPASSPWRTDALIDGARTFAPAELGIRPLVFDPSASSVARVQRSDGEYKAAPPALPAPGATIASCR